MSLSTEEKEKIATEIREGLDIDAIRAEVEAGIALEDNECKICMDREKNCVLVPCGHCCSCYVCALRMSEMAGTFTCPACRAKVTHIQRKYEC